MLAEQSTIPKGSCILVTGANSYIGSNIIDSLLGLGYNVRGTVRAGKPWLNELFVNKYGEGRFETAIIPSLEKEGAFDDAMRGVAGVVHVATDVSLSKDANLVITNVVNATRNALQAAAKQSSVKRFILTSSSSAALIPTPGERVVVTQDTWNDAAVEAAWNNDTPEEQKPYVVYAASKTEGERAAWQWVKENHPNFVLNTVLPNMNYGRILSPEIPGSTMGWTRNILHGDGFVMKLLPPQWYVDVQDCARLHVIALLADAVRNERIFAFAGPYNWTDVIAILRSLRPHRQIPDPPVNEGRDVSDVKPSARAKALLQQYFGKPGWTSLEDALAEGIVGID